MFEAAPFFVVIPDAKTAFRILLITDRNPLLLHASKQIPCISQAGGIRSSLTGKTSEV